MKISIPSLKILKGSLKKYEAKEDKQPLVVGLSPLGANSGYLLVKYFNPTKEVFEEGIIKNALGNLKVDKNEDKPKVTFYLDEFENIEKQEVKEIKQDETNKELSEDKINK